MPMIQGENRQAIQERFQALTGPVTLVIFTQAVDPPQNSQETTGIMGELAGLSDQLSVKIYDFQEDRDAVDKCNVERIPAIVLEGAKDYGVRYYGFPGGYEFGALIEDIVNVSQGDSGLSDQTKQRLSSLEKPVHLRVFSTPT